MSNAGRPTFAPARGSTTQGGQKLFSQSHAYSSRDLPSHKSLKTRQPGQNTKDEIAARDLRRELDDKEKKKTDKDKSSSAPSEASSPPLALEKQDESSSAPPASDDKKRKVDDLANAADADDLSSSSESEEEKKDTNDDEDEEAELMRELEKIKKERAEEAERKAREDADRRAQAMVNSNPLLGNVGGAAAAAVGDFTIKKKWYEDTVFRNQAKDEPEKKKRFINDTTRNDFHRRFLDKYIT